jgi:hypothetical protein
MLDMAQDPFMAAVYRTGLIVALEEFFWSRATIWHTLAFAKYCFQPSGTCFSRPHPIDR